MSETKSASNFIEAEINKDIENNVYENNRVLTRFPPEPNGYLHVGHVKSICLNFGLGEKYHGETNVRFDDTNPTKEDVEYVNSILYDVKWLGFHWKEPVHYASDYFPELYEYACKLIRMGLAYVDDQSSEEIHDTRGDLEHPGVESPWRNRSVEENLRLFKEMKEGKYKDGEKVLRAKIDMASPNMVMRDPVLYRILHVAHHRTGNEWCIYPMYDFAHPLSDAIEKITHSVCTVEFEERRPLYNWCLQAYEGKEKPRQIEFARLNVTTMITSKRKLRRLVESGVVSGWDDPRMPTISGIRRRGYTPESLRHFCDLIGVAKADSLVDIGMLEYCIREDLKKKVPRIMTVIDPVKVVLTNYPEDKVEYMTMENNPEDLSMGERKVAFGRELYIEREDFMEVPARKFFRMTPGKEVRLKGAYIVRCDEVIKDENGEIKEIHCTCDMETRSGTPGADRKVKGTLHWVSAKDAVDITARLYDYMFSPDDQDDGRDFIDKVNPKSLIIMRSKAESAIKNYKVGDRFQFLRKGYFIIDKDTNDNEIFVNRIVGLRDTWAKLQKKTK
ncbi:MAG: glutamine--tRNA ligase/YqeY domain fusion protein [Dialister micraerophilus]|uniref:glutamine--tRNA ligase/YqeY domain fusion protein n=1 Tax=Dialister micraerophilus TaxID=309120 RepID=UPI00254AE1BB|nr:glutamine--tRNA ligase/YqeY domain fusion protein [Dialister micraerophilus]MDK8253616.1 glutamine--tRNA ligase/YqeY domain fusion protein [Dialister micraerophilus]